MDSLITVNEVKLSIDSIGIDKLSQIFTNISEEFNPSLTSRIPAEKYASKIRKFGHTFELFINNELAVFAAGYFNNLDEKKSYLTVIYTFSSFRGNGYADLLLCFVKNTAKRLGMRELSLEVSSGNIAALKLYISNGFNITDIKENLKLGMRVVL